MSWEQVREENNFYWKRDLLKVWDILDEICFGKKWNEPFEKDAASFVGTAFFIW